MFFATATWNHTLPCFLTFSDNLWTPEARLLFALASLLMLTGKSWRSYTEAISTIYQRSETNEKNKLGKKKVLVLSLTYFTFVFRFFSLRFFSLFTDFRCI